MSKIIKILSYISKNMPNLIPTKVIYKSNNHHPIYINDNLFFRSLNFGNSAIQSKMCKLYKNQPVLDSIHMLSFAGELYKKLYLENNKTFDILLLGLGGGDLVRYYNNLLENINLKYNLQGKSTDYIKSEITAIEQSLDVINLSRKYFYLDKIIDKINKNIEVKIRNLDAYEFILSESNKKYNIITVDIFTELDSAKSLFKEENIIALNNKLDNNGILVFNILVSNQKSYNNFIGILQKYFGNNILIAYSKNHYNIIIYVFNNKSNYSYLDFIKNPENSRFINQYLINIKALDNQEPIHTAEFSR